MSVRAVAWALRNAPVTGRSRHFDVLVLVAICEHAHDDGGGAYPNEATIAKLVRGTERGVRNSIARLEAAGILAVERRQGRVNVYTVLMTQERTFRGGPRNGTTGTPEQNDGNPGTERHEPRNARSSEPLEPGEPLGEPGYSTAPANDARDGGAVVGSADGADAPPPGRDQRLAVICEANPRLDLLSCDQLAKNGRVTTGPLEGWELQPDGRTARPPGSNTGNEEAT